MTKEAKVSIVGGGLSAIFSYWGCLDAGYKNDEIEIYCSDIPRTEGAVFLYECPISWPQVKVTSTLLGTCRGYSMKQWNDPTIITSVHKRFSMGLNPVVEEYLWLPQDVITTLWGMVSKIVRTSPLTEGQIDSLAANREAVICTFPAQDVWDKAIEWGYIQKIPIYISSCSMQSPTVVYNGLDWIPWVRQTIMSTQMMVEYPRDSTDDEIMTYEDGRGNYSGMIRRVKEVASHAKFIPSEIRLRQNILSVGRFSRLDPKVFSHHARSEVRTFLSSLDADI